MLPDRRAACSPVCAFTCLPVCAFICLPVLPDRRAACSPVCAFTRLPVCAFMCLPMLPDSWAACLPVRAPSMCLHVFPKAARSWGRMLASVHTHLSPSSCLPVSHNAGSPGRKSVVACLPARAFIWLPVLPDRWAACVPVCAFTCPARAFICLPVLPARRAACSPVCALACHRVLPDRRAAC